MARWRQWDHRRHLLPCVKRANRCPCREPWLKTWRDPIEGCCKLIKGRMAWYDSCLCCGFREGKSRIPRGNNLRQACHLRITEQDCERSGGQVFRIAIGRKKKGGEILLTRDDNPRQPKGLTGVRRTEPELIHEAEGLQRSDRKGIDICSMP